MKGLEIPGYEPRALQTMALGFAVGARGADHNRSGAYEVDFSDKVDRRHATLDSVRHAIDTEDRAALMDSLILCKFLRGVFADFHAEAAGMLRAVTGWDVTADELRDTARRIVAAKRQVNLLAGWTLEEDTLPERFLDTPLPERSGGRPDRRTPAGARRGIPSPARLVGGLDLDFPKLTCVEESLRPRAGCAVSRPGSRVRLSRQVICGVRTGTSAPAARRADRRPTVIVPNAADADGGVRRAETAACS